MAAMFPSIYRREVVAAEVNYHNQCVPVGSVVLFYRYTDVNNHIYNQVLNVNTVRWGTITVTMTLNSLMSTTVHTSTNHLDL